MAKRIWKDRVVEKPRTFNINNNPDGTVTLVPAPGTIIQEGTPVNAANLNGLEEDLIAHEADYTLQIPFATTTGTANNYAISLPIESLITGMAVSVKINVASTGASTLNWNGKGAKPIKKANGTDVTNLKANGIYTLRYDGVNFILQGEGASGNAIASDLLLGKTATVDVGEIVGTLIPGKKWATGTFPGVTVPGTNNPPNAITNTVTGLDFLPSIIIVNNSPAMVRNFNDAKHIKGVYSSIDITFNTRAVGGFSVIYQCNQPGSQFIPAQTWFACD